MTSAEDIARAVGLSGRVAVLPSERTLTLLVGEDPTLVLKVHPEADRDAISLETAALEHLAGHPTPKPVLLPGGRRTLELTVDGRPSIVRALAWQPGRAWSAEDAPSARALGDLGRLVARVDAALADFRHPGAARPLRWNLAEAASARELFPHVPGERRALTQSVLDRFADVTQPALARLPAQPIHNDANGANILLDGAGRVSGLIDFGDLCTAPRVCGLAVACAYAMSGPNADAAVRGVLPLVAGYHEVAPLEPAELALLFDLIRTRLALSVCMAGWQHAADPANEYLLVSQDAVWSLLALLAGADPDLAHFRVRDACGYEADPRARSIRAHLAAAEAAPILAGPLAETRRVTFDWSAGMGAAAVTAETVVERMADAGADVGIGRYLENRDVYASPAYATADGERRTVHLGVDLFAPPGTAVHAPLDGTVHAFADNAFPLDYGPVVVLRHLAPDGEAFYTLYGHLSRASLSTLVEGMPVKAGDRIAMVGEQHENGGWAPHVHVQVLTSLVGLETDVPGVAARSDLSVWQSISPDPNLLLGVPEGVRANPGTPPAEILRGRRTSLSRALSLGYADPLHIVEGRGAYVFDAGGGAWLDLVNNVAHVGHGHPRVVVAGAAQMAMLNTNTRYLHEAAVSYAQRLAATLPDPLSVCLLTNSGSEANDLALRLARAHSGARDVVVLDHAYHGNLTSLIDVSPYKFNGPGGSGRPVGTHVVPLPDPYRGLHRAAPGAPSAVVTPSYLSELDDVLSRVSRAGQRIAALLAEAMPGTAGQVVLADGFLASAYQRIRAAGGVCIADEVQTGLGRTGAGFWAFELHGVVPDIVTMGKPLGNGHPLGAVVTTPEIARSFANGMEYFNTFGGNPVSARVGLAVLDVVADEGLQWRAARLGDRLLADLRELAERHPLVGDVRGSGLFLGIQLVDDLDARTPATAAAAFVVEEVKRHGVLVSADGPDHNVLKVKPPMVVNERDCDAFVVALDAALGVARSYRP